MSVVNVTNVNVNVTNFQNSYNQLGLGPIPAGTVVATAVGTIEKALIAKLFSSWPSTYPASVSNQADDGIMEPWSANVAGTAPSCVVQQIQSDLNSWQLPYSTAMLNEMASQITTEISANGGQTGVFYGQSTLASSETVYWGVAYTTAVVIGPPSNTTGILYAFTAVLGLS